MEIRTLHLGPLETNCYIVSGTPGRCAVIDPGGDGETLLEKLAAWGLTPEAVLLTHRHFDHVGAADTVARRFACPIYLHAADRDIHFPMLFGKVGDSLPVAEGDCLEVAGLRFTVLHTPGHSEGSVCLRCGDALFSGDTLFAGSCGRVDFPGSSKTAMRASLKRLATLSEDLRVFPGHGGATTLLREKETNPYLL